MTIEVWGPKFGDVDRGHLTPVGGGVTAAAGFRAGGVTAGIKASGKPDVALVVSDKPAGVAVVTTTNRFKAAPCVVSETHASNGAASAVIINSGNANACTGAAGHGAAVRTTEAVGEALGVPASDVLVCSTGVIGVPLPLDVLLGAIPKVVADLDSNGGQRAAEAIMTTDSVAKETAYRVTDTSGECTIGGMAKGAGMIEPAMATMICVVTIDAPIGAAVLKPMVAQAASRTFNRISIDACGSTNDTVIVMAAGTGAKPPALATVSNAIEAVFADLAEAIVADGEGTTKVAEIRITGAASSADADAAARAVSSSVLFRAALAGADPNWGRVLAAIGATDVAFDPDKIEVAFGPVTLCRAGAPTMMASRQAEAAMQQPRVPITIDLGAGREQSVMLTADLTPEYVAFNADYTT